jgi:hypothetical protein
MRKSEVIIQGLQIINAHAPEELNKYDVAVEHEVLYAGYHHMPKPAQARLKALGWHYDDDFDCWALFL